MSSILRTNASRANGAKSRGPITEEGKLASAANSAKCTGPRTPEGKARSSQNAVRHGLLAQATALPSEQKEELAKLLAAYEARFQPADDIERHVIETMAMAEWRLERTRHFETAQLAHASIKVQQTADEFTLTLAQLYPAIFGAIALSKVGEQSNSLENMRRYEVSYSREYQRSFKIFKELRAERLEQQQHQELMAQAVPPANEAPPINSPEIIQITKRNEPNLGEILTPQPAAGTSQTNHDRQGVDLTCTDPLPSPLQIPVPSKLHGAEVISNQRDAFFGWGGSRGRT